MGHSGNPIDQPQPSDGVSPNNRRAFIRHTLTGLAIAVPAVRALTGPATATAGTAPLAKCSSTYLVYQFHYCSTKLIHTCPTGWARRCWGLYNKYDVNTGAYCGEFFDDEGPCGTA